MAVSSQQIRASFSPLVAEAVAILKGIQLAFDSNLVSLDLVSDAAVTVGLVNDMKNHSVEIGLVIDAIRKLMLSLPGCILIFAPRGANFVAHTLSKNALSIPEDHVWLEDFPLSIRRFLLMDALGCI
ncbi:hypothetical protein Q3G72_015784 [Acer saccharum]|nr:hypothetical protein Q3G72_015784 [Acer saccharum]